MPRPKRPPQEINAFKDTILEEALYLMNRHGFEGFSMRKLGKRLGVSAKTIYNYYKNKDELYLVILTRGFALLYERFNAAFHANHDPFKRLEAMGREYLVFGIERANLYNLMFTWHVPKFNDYAGTTMEPVARVELDTALKVSDIFIRAVQATDPGGNPFSEEEARFHMIWIWSQLHGFIAGYNNTLLDYMHEKPITLSQRILDQLMMQFKSSVADRNKKGKLYRFNR